MRESTQRLAFYLLTGPQTNRIGLFHFSIGTASEDLKVASETIRKGLDTVSTTFNWLYDESSRVVYIPSWWRWNPPSNPKHLQGNLSDLGEVPPCSLVDAFARNVDTLPVTLHETFVEGCRIRLGTGMANQNQNQNHKQKQNLRASRGAENETPRNRTSRDEVLARVAREAVSLGNPEGEFEVLIDTFRFVLKEESKDLGKVERAEIIQALNQALVDRRRAVGA